MVSNFNLTFQNACMVYKHAVVAAFCIYAQRGEVAAKKGGGGGGGLESVH